MIGTVSDFMTAQVRNVPVASDGPADRVLLLCVSVLLVLGLIMVGSASVSIADQQTGQPFYYLWRQVLFTSLGIGLGLVVVRVPLDMWQRLGPLLMMCSIGLLVLVFLPGLGREVNGSQRWIVLGPINLQPSELVKLFTIIYLSGYLVRHREEVQTRASGFLRPMALLLLLVALLLLEPDYGAAAVMVATAVGMMWLGGARLWQFLVLLVLLSFTLAGLALLEPYRLTRLTVFLDPWADPFDSGFQLTQALIAFGRGEWFGVGLGASVQKLFYLPEAHTDFLFAVFAEEFGLFGVLVVLAVFAVMLLRILIIGRRAEYRARPFAAFLAYGIGIWLGLQAFINIGVNMGVLPTKGLTLPMMSYGGSSIVVTCLALALVLRVDYETRRHDRVSQMSRGRKRGRRQ